MRHLKLFVGALFATSVTLLPQGAHAEEGARGVGERFVAEFWPREAVDPDHISGIDDVMADAVTFKYIPAPPSKQQLDDPIQIPERKQ